MSDLTQIPEATLASKLKEAREAQTYWKAQEDLLKQEILRRNPDLKATAYFKFSLHQSVQVEQELAWDFLSRNPELKGLFKLSLAPKDFERLPSSTGFATIKASPVIRTVESKKEAA